MFDTSINVKCHIIKYKAQLLQTSSEDAQAGYAQFENKFGLGNIRVAKSSENTLWENTLLVKKGIWVNKKKLGQKMFLVSKKFF